MKLHNVIETTFVPVMITDNLRNLVKKISVSKRNIFPVIDEQNKFYGVILLDNVRKIMFDTSKYDSVYVSNLMVLPLAVINKNDTTDEVLNKFNTTGAWNLPVIDKGEYVGFVSKSTMLGEYRKLLVKISHS